MSVFYKQLRIGKNGKLFYLYKFRTMIENADKIGGLSTSGDDPRLTRIGKFLRKYKLDELPQLWNVLRGDMSFVGPRPEVPEVVDLMTEEEKRIILSVRPGMTDLASIWDINEEDVLRGEKNPHEAYLKKIWPHKKELQIFYIQNQNLWGDLKIIFFTLKKLLKR